MLLATDWPCFLIAEGQVMHEAPWTYECDEQGIFYEVLLSFDVEPEDRSVGITQPQIIDIGVHGIESAVVYIGKCGAKLVPSENKPGWESEITRRLEYLIENSEAVRKDAEQACWDELERQHLDALAAEEDRREMEYEEKHWPKS